MRGLVAIKDGHAVVQDPPEGGTPATLTPKEGVRLLVNGRECEDTTPVWSTDEIVLEPQEEAMPPTINITVSPDRMQAWVQATPESRVSRAVVDQPPAADLVLETETKTSTAFPWTVDEVVGRLREQGVTHGILEDNIAAFLRRGTEGSCLAAQGTPPEPPVDEEVVVLFNTEQRGTPAVKEDGTVDFKDLQLFASVTAGTLLATKRRAVPGKDGTTVDGEPVPAPAPKRFVLQAGRHAEVSADGLSVTASVGGRPTVDQRGGKYVFDVIPVLEHVGDVNLKTGNIRFAGDMKITGSVSEGMSVAADGRLEIVGGLSGAVAQGERGVVVHGHVFSSEIRAGGKGAHLAKFIPPLKQLITTYGETLLACRQLAATAARAGKQVSTGQLFLLLVDERFKQLPAQAGKLQEMVAAAEKARLWLPDSLKEPLKVLHDRFLTIEVVQLSDLEPLAEVLGELRRAGAELADLASRRSDVVLASVVNSVVEATGSVQIGTRGSYNSTINAGGEVRIDGSLKGGQIQAQEDVWVATAGNPRGGVKSRIQTTRERRVAIGLAYPGVVVQIENRQVTIENPLRNVTAVLDPQKDAVQLSGTAAD